MVILTEDELCVGRKEIVVFFQELRLISKTTCPADGWRTVQRWGEKYGLKRLFHRLPNGKPVLFKAEIKLWLARTDELSRRLEE